MLVVISFATARIQGITISWGVPAPWLFFTGGCLGAAYVTSALILVPRLGTAATMAFVVAGQLLAGMVIDPDRLSGHAVPRDLARPHRGRRTAACWRADDPHLLMRVDLFDFDLPQENIALRPAEPRDAARMLVVRPGEALEDRGVRDLPSLLSRAISSSSTTPRSFPPN